MDQQGLVVIVAIVAMFFMPSLIAHSRKHKNAMAIFVLNLLLGWTVLGWVFACVWACTNNTEPQERGF